MSTFGLWMSLYFVGLAFGGESVRDRLKKKLQARRFSEYQAYVQAGEALEVFADVLKSGDQESILKGIEDLKIVLTGPSSSGGLKRHRQFLSIVEALIAIGQARWRSAQGLLKELPDDPETFYPKQFIEAFLCLKVDSPTQLKMRWTRLQAWDVKYVMSEEVKLSLAGTIPETALVVIGKHLMEAGLLELSLKWFSLLSPERLLSWAWSLDPHVPSSFERIHALYARFGKTGSAGDQLNWLALLIEVEAVKGLTHELSSRYQSLKLLMQEVGEEETARLMTCAQILVIESHIIGDLTEVRSLQLALLDRFPEKILPRLELLWLDVLAGKEMAFEGDWALAGVARYERSRVGELLFCLQCWDQVIDLYEGTDPSGLDEGELEVFIFAYLRRKQPRDDLVALELSKYFTQDALKQVVQAEVFFRKGHSLRAIYLFKQLAKNPGPCQCLASTRLMEIEGFEDETAKALNSVQLLEKPLPRVHSMDTVLPRRSRYRAMIETILQPLTGRGSFEHMKIRRQDVVTLVRSLGGLTTFGKGGHLKVSFCGQVGFPCVLSDPMLPAYQIKQLAIALLEAGIVPESLKNELAQRTNGSGGVIIKTNDTPFFDDARDLR